MIHVGTSGWSYPEWKSSFYGGIPQRRWLEHYASTFTAVEAHMTARRSLTVSVAEKWTSAVPKGFCFATKAPPWATAKQDDLPQRTERFASSLAPLGQHVGPVLLVPPFKRDEGALEVLLAAWPKNLQIALELRHNSWAKSNALKIAAKYGAALVTVDRQETTDPLALTADHAYIRLRRDSYHSTELERWAGEIRGLGADTTWVFVRHGEDAPAIANELHRLLA